MPTVSDILDEARGTYLNDPAGGTYTNAKLLPHLKSAYAFLQSSLEENGVQCKNEEVVKTINAGLDEYFPLPVDLVIPRKMQERTPGTTEEFVDMSYFNNIPQETPGSRLQYWTWRTDRIYLLESTANREVKLFYQKAFPAVNTATDQLFGRAEQYLAAKVGALAHLFLSQNKELAQVADKIAENELLTIINMQVRLMQTLPASRKPYLPYRRR